jgi:diadenosine tetraphosphate (Ap4A) HIT family hydrolase
MLILTLFWGQKNMKINGFNEEELLKKSFGELVDLGICPTCFDRQAGGKYFGDCSNMELYKDEDIECMFVGNPRAQGHLMISSMKHYHDLSEAPDWLNEKIIDFAKQFMIIIKEVFGCERVYLCTMSDGPMNHYHIQLIPRYDYEERGSKNFVKPRQKFEYSKEKTELVRKAIKKYAKERDGKK